MEPRVGVVQRGLRRADVNALGGLLGLAVRPHRGRVRTALERGDQLSGRVPVDELGVRAEVVRAVDDPVRVPLLVLDLGPRHVQLDTRDRALRDDQGRRRADPGEGAETQGEEDQVADGAQATVLHLRLEEFKGPLQALAIF
jgi:hypothetical protein